MAETQVSELLAEKFGNEDMNALPSDSPESDYFILENALQRGFEMIDDNGDVLAVSARNLVSFVKLYRDWKKES